MGQLTLENPMTILGTQDTERKQTQKSRRMNNSKMFDIKTQYNPCYKHPGVKMNRTSFYAEIAMDITTRQHGTKLYSSSPRIVQ